MAAPVGPKKVNRYTLEFTIQSLELTVWQYRRFYGAA